MRPSMSKSQSPVLACREMTVRETETWLDYYNLSLSVAFSDGVYTVDLRTPVGDGSSVSTMQGKAAGYDVALIAASVTTRCPRQLRSHLHNPAGELSMRLLGEILCRAGLHGWRKLYLGLQEPTITCMRLNCGRVQSPSAT